MSNMHLEHGLARGRKTASVIFRKRGSSLYVYILEPTNNPDVESGEAGSVDADECLYASDILKAWVRKGERHPRSARVPCKLELSVSHYGKVQRIASDDRLDGIPYPEVAKVTIIVETDSDASYLSDLFLEMNRRLRGLQ